MYSPSVRDIILAVAVVLTTSSPLMTGLMKGQSQAAMTFQVASIKPADPAAIGSRLQFLPGGRFSAATWTKQLIMEAYSVKSYQVSGGPSWLSSDRFVVDAKAENRAAGEDQLRLMLQSLLADRFHLKIHRETREFAVYALVVDRNGPKIQPIKDGENRNCIPGGFNKDGFSACGATIVSLAQALESQLHQPVLDKTGLEGKFDLKLDYDQFSIG